MLVGLIARVKTHLQLDRKSLLSYKEVVTEDADEEV